MVFVFTSVVDVKINKHPLCDFIQECLVFTVIVSYINTTQRFVLWTCETL